MKTSLAKWVGALLAVMLLVPAAATASRAATSPTQLLAASVAAAKAASSVHLVASGLETGGAKLSVNLRLTAGKGGSGRITIGSQAIDIVVLKPFVYFKASAGFWRKYAGSSASVAAQLLAGRWVKMSASNQGFGGFISLTNITAFVTELASSHGKLVSGGTKTIDGHAAVGIVDTSKSGGGTLWVAANGSLPLQLDESGGSGHVDFESWNAPVHVTAPRSSLDFSHIK